MSIAKEAKCLEDLSWQTSPGWSTNLVTSFRNATMVYGRLNGTILSHEFLGKSEVAAPINSSELLRAYDTLFGNDLAGDLGDITAMLTGGSGQQFAGIVWGFLFSASLLSARSPAYNAEVITGLHALLAMPLYFFQLGVLSGLRSVSTETSEILPPAVPLAFDAQRPNATISLAVMRYELVVGRATLIAYAALSGITLFLCFGALAISSVSKVGHAIPETTSFPTLDFCTNCDVRDLHGRIVGREEFDAIEERHRGELLREVGSLRVVTKDHLGSNGEGEFRGECLRK